MITDVFTSNHARYGHRDVHWELVKAGWQVAKKTVLKADAAARAGLPVTPREAMRLVSREIG
ncbi:hypothetical protein GCM10017788_59260 [Amycolatopsis acidiphila]|nr:hypothetical protein GCM10017788_59260 [Amycolatopsis acidiphila]